MTGVGEKKKCWKKENYQCALCDELREGPNPGGLGDEKRRDKRCWECIGTDRKTAQWENRGNG